MSANYDHVALGGVGVAGHIHTHDASNKELNKEAVCQDEPPNRDKILDKLKETENKVGNDYLGWSPHRK